MTPGIFGPLSGAMGGIFGGQQLPTGGVGGEPQPQSADPKRDMMMAMASQLLAGSGWSPQRRGLGELMGQALMAGQQAKQQAMQFNSQQSEAQQMAQLRKAQIEQMQRGDSQFGSIDPDQFTPESLAQFQRTKDYGVLVRRPDANMGNFNPGDYTPESFAKFRETGNIRDLQRWVTPANPVVTSVGNVPTVVNPGRGGAPTTQTPLSTLDREAVGAATVSGAEAEATAAGTVTGRTGAEAIANLGTAEQSAQQAIDVLSQLKGHKGLPLITGAYSLMPIIPGTDQAAADALAKQVEGQAFLQAFESLKGGGQITQIEGEKATQAMARLARAQKTEDYQKAVDELLAIANKGLDRARQKAKAAEDRQPGASVRKYNPQTGRIE
jgi:hypothetical protein